MNSLPHPSKFLTDILATLSTFPKLDAESEKNAAPAKPLLLTFHAFFPSTLLPALDLLDRRFVTRLSVEERKAESLLGSNETTSVQQVSSERVVVDLDGDSRTLVDLSGPDLDARNDSLATKPAQPITSAPRQVYYVRSSQWQPSKQYRRYGGSRTVASEFDKTYEVRPWAWSCTCAAFAFAAYNHDSSTDHDEVTDDGSLGQSGEETRGWGGLMGRSQGQEGSGDVPLCKHLLACVLAEWWIEARALVEVKEVEKAEVSGRAAG